MTVSNLNVLIRPVASATYGSALRSTRAIKNSLTGKQSIVLCFDDAEVVMPGNWQIRESEFPNGLYEGQMLAAYWEADETGTERFHLYEVAEA